MQTAWRCLLFLAGISHSGAFQGGMFHNGLSSVSLRTLSCKSSPPFMLPSASASARIGGARQIAHIFQMSTAPEGGSDSAVVPSADADRIGGDAIRLLKSQGFTDEQTASLLEIAEVGLAAAGAPVMLDDGSDALAPLDGTRVFLVTSGEVKVAQGSRPPVALAAGDYLGERRFLELEVLDSLGKLRSDPIQEIFALLDSDGSGTLDTGEVVAAAAKLGLTISDADAGKMIASVDTNQDGMVQLGEASAAAGRLEGTLRQLFRKIDSDGSGKVDAAELRDAALEVPPPLFNPPPLYMCRFACVCRVRADRRRA